VAGSPVTRWGITVPWHENVRLHLLGTRHCCFEIVDLKPKQNTVSIGSVARVANRIMVVTDLKFVQLQYEDAVYGKSLVFRATMRTRAAKQSLVPAAARLDIRHGD
jgi:hypothetical protein